jgi:hypothetical protein
MCTFRIHPHFQCGGVVRALDCVVARGQRVADLESVAAVGPGGLHVDDLMSDGTGVLITARTTAAQSSCRKGLALAGSERDMARPGAPLPV